MIAFTVYGTPVPQGSMKPFYIKKLGRAIVTSDNKKLKPWRQQISQTAVALMNERGEKMITRPSPVRLEADFYFDKPKSVKKDATNKTTKPDADKLLRSLADSLTGIVYEDDSQVSQCCINKRFGSPSRVEVRVSEATDFMIGLPIPFSSVPI